MLTNKNLKDKLPPHGYYKVPHTTGLWKHIFHPIQLSLVVDNFGVKYVRQEHVNYLICTLKIEFTIRGDWQGARYCGISLKWNNEEGW